MTPAHHMWRVAAVVALYDEFLQGLSGQGGVVGMWFEDVWLLQCRLVVSSYVGLLGQ